MREARRRRPNPVREGIAVLGMLVLVAGCCAGPVLIATLAGRAAGTWALAASGGFVAAAVLVLAVVAVKVHERRRARQRG